MAEALGRRIPNDFDHITRYPLRAVMPPVVAQVNRILLLPSQYRLWYDQGTEGACVGYACSWMMSILNRKRYAARWLYGEAQLIDEWTDTPPAEGTSVRAAFDVLRDVGHRPMWGPIVRPAFLSMGIASNRWARSVDELRTSIADGVPFVLGVNWYDNFDTPVTIYGERWIGRTKEGATNMLGRVRGGHAIVGYAASDERQAFRLANSWGLRYPDVWVPYKVAQRLIDEDGEAGVVVDRT